MLRQILGYILAWLSMSLLSSLISLVFLPLMFIGRRIKALAPVMTFLSSALSMFVALLIFIWLCGRIEIQPTYLMFFLPYLAVVTNNFRRIDRAKKSRPTVEESAGEDYDPRLQVKMEYGYLLGDVSGWILFLLSLSRLPLY
jgi:hypothetical protein